MAIPTVDSADYPTDTLRYWLPLPNFRVVLERRCDLIGHREFAERSMVLSGVCRLSYDDNLVKGLCIQL